ncbi:MAG: protein kinase [Acutalibacteraceae bacterium]
MNYNNFCVDCFKDTGGEDICMNCGYSQSSALIYENALPAHTTLNKYIIGRVISINGSSIIYKAFDRSLERIVAIKEFFPAESGMVERLPNGSVAVKDESYVNEFEARKIDFITYAQAIRNSDHDNITAFFDEFEDKGTAYQVMEYLEGLTLEQYFDQVKKLSFEEALDVMMPIMEAVQALHEAGICYQSLSPNNIYMTVSGDVKLGGFSNIKLENGNINFPNMPKLIPGYSAPETYSSANVSKAADIYSLGAIWYKILSGVTPQSANERAKKDKLLHFAKTGAEVPEFVEAVVLRAMSVKESARFANVSDFIASIRGEGWQKKHKSSKLATFLAIAAVLIVLIVGGGTAFYFISSNSIVPMNSTEITIWYPDDGDKQMNTRWKTIAQEFNDYAKNQRKIGELDITLKATGVARDEYDEKLEKAFKDGTAPDIYYSADIEDNKNAFSLENLYSELEGSEDTFASSFEDMKSVLEKDNKVAVCYDVPVLYVSTRGSSYVPEDNATLSFLQNYTEDDDRFFSDPFVCNPAAVLYAAYAYGYKDGKSTTVLKNLYNDARIYKYGKDWKPSDIVSASTKYYLGFASEYNDFYSNCFGKFSMIPLTGKSVKPTYIYPEIWSVNVNSTSDEQKAAIFLFYYLLNTTEGQRAASYVNGNTCYLPFKQASVDEVTSIDKAYDAVMSHSYYTVAESSSEYAFKDSKARKIESLAEKEKSTSSDFNKAAKLVNK